MPIRGKAPIFPPAPKPPTGIFSTRGKQKMDSTAQFKHKEDMAYAYGSSTRSKPTSSAGSQNLRHQKPTGKRR